MPHLALVNPTAVFPSSRFAVFIASGFPEPRGRPRGKKGEVDAVERGVPQGELLRGDKVAGVVRAGGHLDG